MNPASLLQLENRDLEHQHHIDRISVGVALPLLPMYPTQVRPERFPIDLFIHPHRWVAHFSKLGSTLIDVKKSPLFVSFRP